MSANAVQPTEPDLLCIGNVTIDEAVQPDGTSTEALGGDAIFAVLAARLGGSSAHWLAPIGNDLPDPVVAQLVRAGLSLDGLPRRSLPTVRNRVRYDADGTRIWDLLCSDDEFDAMSVYPADVPEWATGVPGLLVLAMSLRSQLTLLPWLRAHSRATLYLDLQEDYLDGHEQELLELVGTCDVFLPSEVEAVRLSGRADPVAAARFFQAAGPRVVVVKLAERGCLVVDGPTVTAVPAEAVVPVDATGAGDAFCGAFAAEHLRSGDPVGAARAGAHAARIAVGGHGVQALLAAAAEVTA